MEKVDGLVVDVGGVAVVVVGPEGVEVVLGGGGGWAGGAA